MTERHLRLFMKWLQANRAEREPEDMLSVELEFALAKFYMSVRKFK